MIGYGILGMLIGAGCFSIMIGLFTPRRSLASRIMTHVATRDLHRKRVSLTARIVPLLVHSVESLGSSRASVARRLAIIGEQTVADFRLVQAQWAGGGLVIGAALGALSVSRGFSPLMVVVLAIFRAVCGALWADSRLTATAQSTSRMLTRQLPDVIELIALAVSAGEAVRPALERVVRLGQGPLIEHLRIALSHVHAGASLTQALTDLAIRTNNRNVSRFTDSLITAMEQGGGLAHTLHNQARDARDASRRELLEEGGKAEISMMIPVVFLILPITVLFTIFPALQHLNFG